MPPRPIFIGGTASSFGSGPLVAAVFGSAAAGVVVVMIVGAAAFMLVVVRVRMAAGILLLFLFNGLAAAGGLGVIAAHGLNLLSYFQTGIFT